MTAPARRARRCLLALGLATTLSVGSVVAAGAASVRFQTRDNWAGFLLFSPKGTQTTGSTATWVVPPVACPPSTFTSASIWTGIGGDVLKGSSHPGQREDLYQTGIDTLCQSGSPQFYAFVEHFGSAIAPPPIGCASWTSCTTADPVAPGDLIAARVLSRKGTTTATISDTRSGTTLWVHSKSWKTGRSILRSAECIVETPVKAGVYVPLASFGQVSFGTCSAVDNHGHLGSIGSASPGRNQMIDQLALVRFGQILAYPSTPPATVTAVGAGGVGPDASAAALLWQLRASNERTPSRSGSSTIVRDMLPAVARRSGSRTPTSAVSWSLGGCSTPSGIRPVTCSYSFSAHGATTHFSMALAQTPTGWMLVGVHPTT